jgi:type II secretory pathway pseudopilin PulG
MVSLKNTSKGFTIIELLIALVFVTFNGVQEKNRDSTRERAMELVEGALDTYYSSNNSYPTYAQLSSPSWVSRNLKQFNRNNLNDPSATGSQTLISGTTPIRGAYAYRVTPTNCNNGSIPCTNFTISARLESDSTSPTFTKESNN